MYKLETVSYPRPTSRNVNEPTIYFCAVSFAWALLLTPKCSTKTSSPNTILQGHHHCILGLVLPKTTVVFTKMTMGAAQLFSGCSSTVEIGLAIQD